MTWERWVAPRSEDEQVARQERLVNIIALGGAIAGGVYLLSLAILPFLSQEVAPASLIGGAGCVILALAAYRLSRVGRVRAAAILVVVAAALIGLYSVYARGTLSVSVVVLAPSIVLAGMAIGGHAAWITSAVDFALFVAMVVLEATEVYTPPIGHVPTSAVALTAVSLGLLTLVTVQTLRVMDRTVSLMSERESALRVAHEEQDRLLRSLQAREEAQSRLLETVRELGSPIIPLVEGIIAMPLIGTVDTVRAQQMLQTLLQGVADHRARTVIVDITGVPVVDTDVAGALVRALSGARLLGAETVLTGIRAEVAQTIVELGLDLTDVVTRGTLQEGLAYALAGQSGQLAEGQRPR